MKILENIIRFLQFEMETPSMYGWFHIICFIIMILLIVFLSIKKYKTDRVLLVLSSIMLIFEVYKQLSFSFNGEVWNYQWYAFPFQFCSTPMYVGFIASLLHEGKLKKCMYAFLATYGLVGGLSVMVYPSTVFISETLISIQTMIHHGFMVVMGSYLIIKGEVKCNLKSIVNGMYVFIFLIILALIGDIFTYQIGLNNGLELFYISPYHTCSLPVLSIIYDKVSYPIFLIFYIFIFTVGCYIPLLVGKLFKKDTI